MICDIEKTNELADQLRKINPMAAAYYLQDIINELDRLQKLVNTLTKDQ